ncbi:MAG: hypothetical protein ACI87E_003468 [Mariniblastus sp.]|jgi:hypothetical protein
MNEILRTQAPHSSTEDDSVTAQMKSANTPSIRPCSVSTRSTDSPSGGNGPTTHPLLFKMTTWVAYGAVAMALMTQTGCQLFRRFGTAPQPLPVAFKELPTQQQLIANIEARAASVQQLSSKVSVSIQGVPAKIKGTLQVEFPDLMRMKAGIMGVAEMGVDVGSNRDNFWIWSRASLPNQPPAFYYANHREFEQSPLRQSIPIDPKWLVDGIGLIRFQPTDQHYPPTMSAGGRIKLLTVRQTASGPQTRQLLLNARSGLIEQQAIYDPSQQLLAYSNSSEYKTVMHNGIPFALPQKIELFMVQPNNEFAKMVIELGSISLNQLNGAADVMWAMPNPSGVQKINLTQVSALGSQQAPLNQSLNPAQIPNPYLNQNFNPNQYQNQPLPQTPGVGYQRN